jgi:D-alanine-D-alanine ligase
MTKPYVLVMFGGVSAEHEVSIITGLQVLEKIDRQKYQPLAVYVSMQGQFCLLPSLTNRSQFLHTRRVNVSFGRDAAGGYILTAGLVGRRYAPVAAYLAFHGGQGESGPIQGLLESMGIPFTSPGQESAVLVMNKQLTKQQMADVGVDTVSGISVFASEVMTDAEATAKRVQKAVSLPAIIKPAHLGSSIGIKVAKTAVELEKYLLEASHMDNEIVVEPFLKDFVEYNCSVRSINGQVETSEIEKPMSKDEILSFADKYQRGAKKTGGASGMASLQRELPAKIPAKLKTEIQELAKKAFVACRCKGMVRIDFMVTKTGKVYLTEINPIPGSMAFYLWEATGVPFTQQITQLIEQAVADYQVVANLNLEYQTDIVEKFVKS